MFRNVFRLILVFIAAVFVRHVITLIIRAFSQMAGVTANPAPASPPQQSGGELKRDPVCGTFVAVSSSVKRIVNGEVIHFCSTACRDKHQRVA
jgi:YHS domain-containing protein